MGLLNQAEAQAAEGSELVGLALPEQGQKDLPDEGMVGFARGGFPHPQHPAQRPPQRNVPELNAPLLMPLQRPPRPVKPHTHRHPLKGKGSAGAAKPQP